MILNRTKNNDLTTRDRLGKLEGQMSILIMLGVGNFLGMMGLLLARAFA
jgi:hypothetical protein